MKSNLILCCFGLGISVLTSASPYLIGSSINFYLSQDRSYLYALAGASLLIIATPPLKLAANIYLQRTAAKTRYILKRTILTHLRSKATTYRGNPGEQIELIDGDVDGSIYLYHSVFFDTSLNFSIIIFALIITAQYHPLLVLAPLAACYMPQLHIL